MPQIVWIIALLVAFVLLFLLQQVLFGRRSKSRADQLMAQYGTLTKPQLEALPDGEVIDAVIGNLLAKTDDKTLPAYAVIPALSRGRSAVYAVWLFLCELNANSLAAFCSGNDRGFAELAADGLSLFQCEKTAALLKAALETKDGSQTAALVEAVKEERPDRQMIAYIRALPEDFCDVASAPETDASDAPAEDGEAAE
ncbi:MAG: hypothetical protein IJU16_03380 [Clostridia bacterium]|nr:hypothetical protein [Clostridia bacterium]